MARGRSPGRSHPQGRNSGQRAPLGERPGSPQSPRDSSRFLRPGGSDRGAPGLRLLPRSPGWGSAWRPSRNSRPWMEFAGFTFSRAAKKPWCRSSWPPPASPEAGENMPEKYHLKTRPVPPRGPRVGKHGVVDWREDCARCHNCVKKACVLRPLPAGGGVYPQAEPGGGPVLRLHGLFLLRAGLHQGPLVPVPQSRL